MDMSFLFEDSSCLFELVFGVVMIVEGLIQICAGKMLHYNYYAKKYTKESLERFMRPSGIVSIAEGLFFFVFAISFAAPSASLPLKVISSVGVIGCVVVYLYVSKKILVKLDGAK